MADEPHDGPQATAPSTKPKTPPPVQPNSSAKWLAGAAAAVVLLGGGYLAVKNFPAGQPSADVASTDGSMTPSSAQPFQTATIAPDPTIASGAMTSTSSTTTSTTTTASARKRSTASTAAASNAVPETVIGITPVSATTEDNNEVVVTANRRPVWARTPSQRRLSALYPVNALDRGREGEASVHCMVKDSGVLDCVRASEAPANAGFGNAALRVARTFRHAPQRADGTAAAGTPVNLRVVFRISDKDR